MKRRYLEEISQLNGKKEQKNKKNLILLLIGNLIEVYIEGFIFNLMLYGIFNLEMDLSTFRGHLKIFSFGLLILIIVKFIEFVYKQKKEVVYASVRLSN